MLHITCTKCKKDKATRKDRLLNINIETYICMKCRTTTPSKNNLNYYVCAGCGTNFKVGLICEECHPEVRTFKDFRVK